MTHRSAGTASPAIASTFPPQRAAYRWCAAGKPTTYDRQLARLSPVLMGLAGGALCYLLAGLSLPGTVASAEQHNLWLTRRLGFILAPAVALWLGWLQRSWRRALLGGGCGLLAGWLCHQVCSGSFQPLLLALPILLAAVVGSFCAAQRSDGLPCLVGRGARGLLLGLVLGMAYIVLLGLSEPVFWPRAGNVDYTADYVRMMWWAGPFALGLSGAMLLPSLCWAAEVTRPRTSRPESESRKLQPEGAVHEFVEETSKAA